MGIRTGNRRGPPLGSKNGGTGADTAPVKSAYRRYAAQNPEEIMAAVRATFAKAKEGDVAAMREISDRLDGKVPQAIVGADDGPIMLDITWRDVT